MKRYYDNPEHNAAFERCIDVMVKLILKYGPKVLKKMNHDTAQVAEKRKDNKDKKSFRNNET